jgi:hypothetical protein
MTVCRVTSRCNHWNFDRNNAYLQPTWTWAQILQQATNFTSQCLIGIIITNQVQKYS